MEIIEQLLKEVKSSNLDDQVTELCDCIFEEEKNRIEYSQYIPKGPNIFLALEVPGTIQKEIAFICLEREFKEKYIITLWTGFLPKLLSDESEKLKKVRTWSIDEFKQPAKILKEYAKIMKYMKGE